MRRSGVLPRVVRAALAAPGGTCYRHCERPIRVRTVPSALPGLWQVRVCPSGVVSVTSYAEWSKRNPTPAVARTLRRWTRPRSRVRRWDLRLATRRGPELGRPVERLLRTTRSRGSIRVVYWRLYPFRARDGTARRLFACFHHGHASPLFFTADPAKAAWDCPACPPSVKRRRAAIGR
jgi:hypothetical protein